MPFVPTAITYLGSRVIPLFVKRRSFEYSKARSFSHGAEVVSIFLLFRVVWAAVFRTDICADGISGSVRVNDRRIIWTSYRQMIEIEQTNQCYSSEIVD